MFHKHAASSGISSVVWHELLFGVHRLAESNRKSSLMDFLRSVVAPNLPVLPYDEAAARWHSVERAKLVTEGLTPPFADGQIASIAATRKLILVTRNRADFVHFSELTLESWHE